MEYISCSEKETFRVAAELAKQAKAGDIFALEGDLGSGKTTFIKGFAQALEIKKEITSPTFVLLKKYDVPESETGIKFLVHVDCYRMESAEDAYSIGLMEFFQEKDAIVVLEWPNKIAEVLPERVKRIAFEYLDQNRRKITVQ